MNRLGRALKVGPGEGRTAALGVGAIMSAAIGATFGQSGADALFFARAGVGQLPEMLIISGVLMIVASFALTALLGRVSPARLFVALPLALAGIVLAERVVVATDVSWIYPVLWLTVGLAQMVQGLFTWGTYGLVVDTRQAKRLFPLFGAGWILGWVVGGIATRPLASAIGAENLLLVWAGGLVAAFAFGRSLLAGHRAAAGIAGRRSHRRPAGLLDQMQGGFRSVRSSTLMRWMSVAALLFSVLFFSLYLPFSQAAAERYPDADALAGFFGLFSAVTAGAALVWSLFLTGRSFTRFGVTMMLLLLPVLYLGGFGILIVHAGFLTIVGVRFLQMLWVQSVGNPAWEAIVNVLPPTRRDQTRAFLNGVPTQAGTVIAGAIQMAGTQLGPAALSTIGAGAAAITTYACWRVHRSYGEALLEALRAGRPQVFPAAGDEPSLGGYRVDAAAAAAVVAGAADPDVRVQRATTEVLGDVQADQAGPALEAALRDEDATVRETALRSLARSGAPEGLTAALPALSDPDPSVRTAAVGAVDRLGRGAADVLDALRRLLDDEDAGVRSSAASSLLQTASHAVAVQTLTVLAQSVDADERTLAAEALAGHGSPETFGLAAALLADPSPRTRSAAARSLGRMDPELAVPALVDRLDDPDPDVRGAAAAELGGIGAPALETVVVALADPGRPDRVDGAIRSLELLPLDGWREPVAAYAREETARAVADFEIARTIPADGDAARMLRDSLVDRARRRGRNALRSLALLDGGRSTGSAIEHLDGRDQGQVANALEALESLARPSEVRPLLRLWEPAVPRIAARDVWLPTLLHDDDPWIRGCAELVSMTEGERMPGTPATLSEMERTLFLRKVSLFGALAPRDLARIAAVSQERTYGDGETIAGQGEAGEELHIVVSGTIRVLRAGSDGDEVELARRADGDVVGEMALITGEPRMASLVAAGDVRTLQVGRREFEGVLRERPDTAIAVIRELSHRLVESANPRQG